MRGRRRTIASVLAESLAARGAGEAAAVSAAFADACGPRMAREVSCRGVLRDGKLLVVAETPAWAAQVETLAPVLGGRVNDRLGRQAATGIQVHVSARR